MMRKQRTGRHRNNTGKIVGLTLTRLVDIGARDAVEKPDCANARIKLQGCR